jgi:hypothetical protein
MVSGAFPNLRLLVTTSQEDLALKVAYPAAHIINPFRGMQYRQALGCIGPTQTVVGQFGGMTPIAVNSGFTRQTVTACAGSRLVKADVTGIHRAPNNPYKPDAFSGHHSDIFRSEVYDLIAGFVFGV